MRKVLVITYYFPPLGMGGVQRILNFCKYLPKFEWTPVVLTVKDIEYFTYDPDLLKEVSCKVLRTESADPLRLSKILIEANPVRKFVRGITSHPGYQICRDTTLTQRAGLSNGARQRAQSFEGSKGDFESKRKRYKCLSDFLFIPDNKIGWLPFAVIRGLRIIATEKIDAIFSTAPPYTSLIIGNCLKKLCNIPLIIEFQDPWPFFPYPTRFHQVVNEFFKLTLLRKSDAIITVNENIKADLLKVTGKEVAVIPHGYNPGDFEIESVSLQNTKFTITYVGTFTEVRTPLYLLKAITKLIAELKIKKIDLSIEFVGFHTAREDRIIKELGLEDIVHLHSYLPHKECIHYLLNSSILWLMAGEKEGIFLPGKVGEYLGARKPILATVPEGACADLIRATGAGVVVPPGDIDAIKEAIYDFYLKFESNQLVDTRCRGASKGSHLPVFEEFSWINLTKRLSKVFDGVVGKAVPEA